MPASPRSRRGTSNGASMKSLPGFKRTLLVRRARASSPTNGVYLAAQRVIAAKKSARDSKEIAEALTGPIRALRKTVRTSEKYPELLHRVQRSLAYRLARASVDNPNFDALVQSKRYVFVDKLGRVTATNIPIGTEPRVKREDINHLKHLVHAKP